MRVWPLLLVVALAGCTAPPEDEGPESRWTPCPQWIASDEMLSLGQDVDGNASFEIAPASSYQGYAFDLLELELSATGTVQVRFENDGRRLAIKFLEPDPQTRPFLSLTDNNATVQVFLTAVTQGTPAAAGPVVVRVEGQGHLEVSGTPWYRVCGVAPP